MKTIKHIINWTLWSIIGIYALLLIMIHIPAVQNYIGRQVAGALEKKLGTEVTVGRVDLGLLNRLIIDDIRIKDQENEPLLSTNRMSIKMELLPLLEGKVRISSAQLFGANINLYRKTAESSPNFQFVLDSLASKGPKRESTLDLQINSIIIRHTTVNYHQLDAEETPHTFNTKHLIFSDISAYIELNALTRDSLNLNIRRMAFKEHAGIQVDHFSLNAEGNRQQGIINNFSLQTPRSAIEIKDIRASYDLNHLSETLTGEMNIADARLTPSDFSPFLPLLKHFNQTLTVNTIINISPQEKSINSLKVISDDNSLKLQANALIKDSMFNVNIAQADISAQMMTTLKEAIPALPDIIGNLGNIKLSGNLQHSNHRHTANGTISTDIGNAKFSVSKNNDNKYTGHLSTEGMLLGQLVENVDVGQIAAEIDFSASQDSINVNSNISSLVLKDYNYKNIKLDANYQKSHIKGRLKIDDTNIQTEIEGELYDNSRKTVRMTGYIRNLRPLALNLSKQWGDALFSAVIDADFSASNINDAEGSIDLDDFTMVVNDSTDMRYHLDNLHIKSGYNNDKHFLKMNGDIGEAEMAGIFDISTLPQSFINYTISKLPTFPGLPTNYKPTNNNFELTLKLKDTEWLKNIFNIPISFDNDLNITAVVNDQKKDITIDGHLPSFIYNNEHYTGGKVLLNSEEDTTHIQLAITKHLEDKRQTEINIDAKACQNIIKSTLEISNHDAYYENTTLSAHINSIAQLYNNNQGKPEVQVTLLPSRLRLRDTEWNLEPCDILYSDNKLVIDHFNLHHQDQHLIIDGVASQTSNDTLSVDLHDLDVAYILDIVDFHSVDFGGLASGKVYLTNVFNDFNAWAELDVDAFTFLNGRMGNLEANAYWNTDEQRIDLHALTDAGPDAQTFINGYISPKNNNMDLVITANGTPIEFCQSFTKSFLGDIEGSAHGEVRLSGLLNRLYMIGGIAVDGKVKMTALNTQYALKGDTIYFVPDDIVFNEFKVYDRNQHVGRLTGGIHHQSFKNFRYTIDVNAENLLAYDFTDFDGSTICGTVYTTGTANIKGGNGETIINCDITPDKNSSFTYNASNPDAISNQQFITWRESNGNGERPIFLNSNDREDYIPDDLRINFRINATPDATLRVLLDANTGDNISLNGNGVVNASFYNKGPFRMFGTYTTERGTYSMTIQNIIKKNFNFQDGGTIIFGGDPFEAALNLKAVYTVNSVSLSDLNIGNSFTNNTVRVNCLMNILGTAGAPRVEFDLEMPTVNAEEQQMIRSVIASEQELNQQVVYLLGIGRFYTQGANNAGTQQYGQTELAMQSFLSGTVSTQINEVLSQVIKNDDWNIGANISTGNEGWHNAEYEGLISGRMLNNRLLINGQFGYRDNATQATPSFIGDFDIRYLLTPNGNMALKVYNQTNDRYFTRSSLNTQGIGLILKKDFNNLTDLFHVRKRKTNNK